MDDVRTPNYLLISSRNSSRSEVTRAVSLSVAICSALAVCNFGRRYSVKKTQQMSKNKKKHIELKISELYGPNFSIFPTGSHNMIKMANKSDDFFENVTNMMPMENPSEMLNPWVRSIYLPYILSAHIFVFAVGSIGNTIVITIMINDRKTHNVTTHLFLQSLAFADLLMIIICTPLEVYQYFAFDWDAKGLICKLASLAQFMSAIASVLNLLAVTFERFIVIVFPLRSRAICTLNNCRRAVAFVWTLSALLATPVLFTKDTYTMTYYNNSTSVSIHYCNDVKDEYGERFSLYQLVLLFVTPGSVMIVCYTYVIGELWRSTKSMQFLTNSEETCKSKCKESKDKKKSGPPDREMESQARRETEPTAGPSSAPDIEVVDEPANEETTREDQLAIEAKQVTEKNTKRFDEIKTARKQVIKMLVLVITMFHLCWGPNIVMFVLVKHGVLGYSGYAYVIRLVVNFLPFFHACINPFIYCAISKKFRKRLKILYRRMCCKEDTSLTSNPTQSRECRGRTQVTSTRQYRRRESTVSARLLQHRGSTTTSSTNINPTEVVQLTEQKPHIENPEKIQKIDIIDEDEAVEDCETAL